MKEKSKFVIQTVDWLQAYNSYSDVNLNEISTLSYLVDDFKAFTSFTLTLNSI